LFVSYIKFDSQYASDVQLMYQDSFVDSVKNRQSFQEPSQLANAFVFTAELWAVGL